MPAVIVPWRGGCRHRQAALDWIRERIPYRVILAEAPPGPWIKALAVMPAIRRWTEPGDVVVVSDADVFSPTLERAVTAVADGAGWAVPHGAVHRLSEAGTKAVFEGADWRGAALEQRPYRGMLGGGIVVARHETLLEVPMDPRFRGWGGEDEAWGLALELLVGRPVRIRRPLVHLWHPPQERLSRRWGSPEGRVLARLYGSARHNRKRMKEILDDARQASESTSNDHPARAFG